MTGESGESGQNNYRFLASFSGRPQQLGFFFNQKNTGNVSHPIEMLWGAAPLTLNVARRYPE